MNFEDKTVHVHRWWVLAIVLPLLSGCLLVERNQRGVDIDPFRLAQIQRGVSTKADVLRILGVPSRKSVLQEREAWVYDFSLEENRVSFYFFYTRKRKTIQQRSVAVLFAEDRVHDYMFLD